MIILDIKRKTNINYIMNKKKKVIVLKGGFSEEREISLVSGKEIGFELEKAGYQVLNFDPAEFDSYAKMILAIKKEDCTVFNALHGAEGEDGRIQAMFELNHIPFTGSGSKASAIAMDKFISSKFVESLGIPIPKKMLFFSKEDFDIHVILRNFNFPFIIKPNCSGSSVGISIVENENEVLPAFDVAYQFGKQVLVEDFICGREITVTILAEETLPVIEVKPKNGWYDYANKYTKGNTEYITPAMLSESERKEVQAFALESFQAMQCKAYGRVDFRYDNQTFYFLEVNTLPGMTPLSLTPMAAKAAGYSFVQLLEKIMKN
jgi:D-alanine-D-alanine ligase